MPTPSPPPRRRRGGCHAAPSSATHRRGYRRSPGSHPKAPAWRIAAGCQPSIYVELKEAAERRRRARTCPSMGAASWGILTPGEAKNRGFGRVVRRNSLGESCHTKLQMCRTPIGETLCAILHLSVRSTALTGLYHLGLHGRLSTSVFFLWLRLRHTSTSKGLMVHPARLSLCQRVSPPN